MRRRLLVSGAVLGGLLLIGGFALWLLFLVWMAVGVALVRPRAIVCLGATAAQALLGRGFRVTTQRGTFVESSRAPLGTLAPSLARKVRA